ncbi:hypothetical protein GCM10011608_25780 [Micromonospora sonchi]|uniref:DUF1622 domain-containing protein n=1 Tax=Micromonospora sonchi TaxID=1763543 RepID=A0A917TX32_9ACTN|nr:DUF1622 domain-containing protein [Micromonospora sonchi]GGM39840.1 hypothetical protein GCM10011608_25780 [Micromonospora sonchi]
MMGALSAVVTVLGAFVALVALVVTRSWPAALGVLLDMLVAAGLLRLVGEASLRELGAVAAIVVLRVLLRSALFADYRWWRCTDPGRPSVHPERRPGPDG